MTSPTLSAAPTAHSSAPSSRPCEKSPACCGGDEDNPRDESKDLTKPCHGWPQLVNVMVDQPGFESFQSFRDLNIKSLLYYQAELVQLRKELHALEWEDHREGGDQAEYCENIRALLATKEDSIERREQISKVKEIRTVLKDYNAALLQYAEINKLPKAESFNVNAFREWIYAKKHSTLTIRGPGADSWGKLTQKQSKDVGLWCQFWKLCKSVFREERLQEDYPDLVVPGKEEDTDSLTRWVASQGTPFWHNLKIAFKETRIYTTVQLRWRSLCRPLRKTDEERSNGGEGAHDTSSAEKNPGGTSIFSILKRRIFQKEKQLEKKEEKCDSLSTYSMHRMVRFTNFVATVIACLLPIVGIVVLSELHTKAKTLGFIALFTAIFAIGIMILTDKRTSRTEVFTATAAFAAVLVVFVQNQSPASVSG